jgi:hypothetical protein
MSAKLVTNCQCSCGATTFYATAEPVIRLICHCLICQEFNQAAFSDVIIYRAKDITFEDKSTVEFNAYKAPPAVQRGKCKTCHKPAIEFFNIPLLPALVLVPVQVIASSTLLAGPSFHLFYNRRHQACHDDLPKHSGYFNSQSALTYQILKSLLFNKQTPR